MGRWVCTAFKHPDPFSQGQDRDLTQRLVWCHWQRDWGPRPQPLAKYPVSKTLTPYENRAGEETDRCHRCVDVSFEELLSRTVLCEGLLRNVSPCARHCRRPSAALCCGSLTAALGGGRPPLFYRGAPEIGSGLLSKCQAGTGTPAATWLPQLCALGEVHSLASLAQRVPGESVEHQEHLSPGTPKSPFHYAAGTTARCEARPHLG